MREIFSRATNVSERVRPYERGFRGSALEWYNSELDEFYRGALTNDPGMSVQIKTLAPA